jgi:hypothetical protein
MSAFTRVSLHQEMALVFHFPHHFGALYLRSRGPLIPFQAPMPRLVLSVGSEEWHMP